MASNAPSRWLGPAALAAAVLAVLFIVASSMRGGPSEEPVAPAGTTTERRETQTGQSSTSRTSTTPSTERSTYRVRPGDTLQVISERTGVSIERLQELNPDLDPQALTVGQRLKLKE